MGKIMIRKRTVNNVLAVMALAPMVAIFLWALTPDATMRAGGSCGSSGISRSRGYSKPYDGASARLDANDEPEAMLRKRKDYSDFLIWKPKGVKASDFRTYGARYHAPGWKQK